MKIFTYLLSIFFMAMNFETIAETKSETEIQAPVNVLMFAGSTRQDSVNKKLIKEAAAIALELGAKVEIVDLKDFPIPFYDADEEKLYGYPKNAKAIRDLMLQSQVIFIASPNYNNSFPAIVKNIVDWTSRTEEAKASREAYKGKTFVLMSAGYGPQGGVNGLSHLQEVIENIGGTVIHKKFGVPDAHEAFDEHGGLENPLLKVKLEKFIKKALNQIGK